MTAGLPSERDNTRRPAHLSIAFLDTLFLNESGWERLMQTQGMAFLRVDPIGCGDACVQWDAFWDEISSTFPGMTWALSCSTAAGACASQPEDRPTWQAILDGRTPCACCSAAGLT